MNEIELQFDNIGDQIGTIVESIITHRSIISELEREIADLSNPPSKSLHSSGSACATLSRTAPSSISTSPTRSAPPSPSTSPTRSAPPSSSTSPFLPTPTTCSAPPTRHTPPTRPAPPTRSTPSSRTAPPTPSSRTAHPTHPAPSTRSAPPTRSTPSSRTALPTRPARPSRSATYWRSTPSSRSPNPLPTSTLPRHLAPLGSSPPPPSPSLRTPSRSIPPANSSSSYHFSQYSDRSARIAVAERPPNKKNSILILGDSNTRHVKLSNAYNLVGVPTFLIPDIDPARCKGYDRVWIHCGINNLRFNRCTRYSDVIDIFKIFMNKLGEIRNMCHDTKIYVSPILSCAIPTLNDRAAWFNRLLLSVRNIWWHELKFDQFCCQETGMLASQFRSFRNRGDKIHLGRHGINALEHALLCSLNKVDGRLYSAVVINR